MKPVYDKAKIMDLVYLRQQHESDQKNKHHRRFVLLKEIYHHQRMIETLQKKIDKLIIEMEI